MPCADEPFFFTRNSLLLYIVYRPLYNTLNATKIQAVSALFVHRFLKWRNYNMDTKDVIYQLRTKNGLSQDELAEKLFVTRQAVSRWENGDTQPNTDTLKLLSKLFDVSINTLLGSPCHLVCQCCGMPLDDTLMSRDPDGGINEEYCKWCYVDGKHTYTDMDALIDFCVEHMSSAEWSREQVRDHMSAMLPKLNYWKANKE